MRIAPLLIPRLAVIAGIQLFLCMESFGGEATTMPPLTVTDRASDSYEVSSTRSATRTETPIEQIPQSVISVTRKVIEDQDVHTLSDALRNVSNVSAIDPRDSNNSTFRIRGFQSATVVDGIAMPGYFPNQESLVSVERIDVLKGPAGALFGSSQGAGSYGILGGTIALTTRAPESEAHHEIGVRVGSHSTTGVNFDVNQPLSAETAVRLSGEYQDGKSETDGMFSRSTALFPSFSWTPNADTRVVLRLRYLDNRTLDYSGLPPDGTLKTAAYQIPRQRNVTARGLPDTTNESNGVNLQWRQRLNDVWNFQLVAGYNQAEVDQRGVFPFPFGGPGPFQLLAGARLWDKWEAWTFSPSLSARFDWGSAKHEVNLGIDYEKTKDDAYMAFSNGFGVLDLTFTPTDLRNPVYPAWVEPVAPSTPDQQNRYDSMAFYVQDQITIADRLHLLASLRQSQIKVTDVNPAFGVNNKTDQSKTTPRLGAVYEFTPQISAFIGYSEGIKVPTVSIFTRPPKPEESEQTEIGLRLKGMGGITATLVVFDLTRKNVAVADPLNFGKSVQVGKQRSKGADLDLVWQATPEWRWLVAMSSQDPKVVEDTVAGLQGKQLFNTPKQTTRVATRYDFHAGPLNGLGLGLGLTHNSELPGDQNNTFFTPAVTIWDAHASYLVGAVRLGLNVTNLSDKKYWAPSTYFGGGQVISALRRGVSATASVSF